MKKAKISDSEKLDKALRYSGESPEAFARHLFGTVPGARHHLLKQARRRHEYVQRSAQAAVIIQAWWRRKKHRECSIDTIKKEHPSSRNPWNTETPKPRSRFQSKNELAISLFSVRNRIQNCGKQ